MRVDPYAMPGLAPQSNPSPSDEEIKGWLLCAIDKKTNNTNRRLLEDAAALIERLMDELKAYRDAAEYDFTRPRDTQFRGWNMANLIQARKKTEAPNR
jgi:hypothetical protein